MFEQLLSGKASENSLYINCETALILRDREGFLEKFDSIHINCGAFFASTAAYTALLEKGANINCGRSSVRDIAGEVVQIEAGADITAEMDFSSMFVVSSGDAVVRGDGGNALANAEGAHFGGTLYYPRERNSAYLSKVTGQKQAYPQDAHLIFGDRKLEDIPFNIPNGNTFVWVNGEVSALEDAILQRARDKNLRYVCRTLLTYAALDETYGDLFDADVRVIVPDGYEVTPSLTLTAGAVSLYGPRMYVRGDLHLDQKHVDCLGEIESLIIKGTATIPTSCAKVFKAISKADAYELLADDVGGRMDVQGIQTIGHGYLQTLLLNGKTIHIACNGILLFDEDVTAEDMDAIEALSVKGLVVLPDPAQGALSQKVKKINGMVLSIEALTKLTGMTITELLARHTGDIGTSINTGFYLLV